MSEFGRWLEGLEPAAEAAFTVTLLVLAGFLIVLGARFYLRQQRHFRALDRIELEHARVLDWHAHVLGRLEKAVTELQARPVGAAKVTITAETDRALELLEDLGRRTKRDLGLR